MTDAHAASPDDVDPDERSVDGLVAAMGRDPAGRLSPSVYETGRLVALAPWLTGHASRLRHLLDRQRPDGGWGAPEGYALVPTLSAVDALLTTLTAATPVEVPRDDLRAAAVRGLATLAGWLGAGQRITVPDTPAVDLIVPALVDAVNAHLRRDADLLPGAAPLLLPAGMDRRRADAVRGLVASGRPVPQKLLHALEVLGPAARRRADVRPLTGAVGASPAATAAWVGDPGQGADPAALTYLDTAVGRLDGPVPCCTPIAVFERSWVLANLARAGVPADPAPDLVAALAASLGPDGTATGPGLPADADTTSVTLYALARAGHPVDPGSLSRYDLGSHFCTWQGEDGSSVTTNAHVLEALGWHAAHRTVHGDAAARRLPALAGWLREQQQADGRWSDRWHASPYYATSCAVLALNRYASAAVAATPVGRAVDWVVDTQRADGSWGRWAGTREETAYALHVLLGIGPTARPGVPAAARRGVAYLAATADQRDDPPLWHDKDLYAPVRIVRAAIAAARHLAAARPELTGVDGGRSPRGATFMIRNA
ncbi:Prenyltransferase and squalene oxidase repeat-containing protein [Micromonospora viridifaciens]|uniref:Prenyltransferase and squalene oxidase repeat-containing protein n=1 Tax=Micromonospora viridifaciens TaxID=1881 RepID=A0A1C4W8W2_MICVI|nr:prenyltransferase/squalene oxidase repeat-containing protein [Micromonospora viridifaciens]SCE92666.1 Prenyltransferase and squalene oxidase repeat-containing protein [Micromonospora viridifaciens]